ncbi:MULTISPECIES: hypothetical protein [unclassified Chryseobacterium]|uniref:hypothetical protein n=1 Tax=unclassified Chryseobacterium TaxID=2593645 RepID=UPI00226AE6A9|nr:MULTISPECIES: hypothetical protein [unclassified Chryseobacterium]
MRGKLILAIIFFILSILSILMVFILNDTETLLKIQLPLIILFGYLWTTFGVSYIFDFIISKSVVRGQQNQSPYNLLSKYSLLINAFIFIFFGILATVAILILLLSEL